MNATNKPTLREVSEEMHAIGVRLAGVVGILRRTVFAADSEVENIIGLIADITAKASHDICAYADDVSSHVNGGA